MFDRRYSRDETAFFTQWDTVHAVTSLAKSKQLVIYCGAGVSIDQTGMSWSDLIFNLLRQFVGKKEAHQMTSDDAWALRKGLNPLVLSSIYEQCCIDKMGSTNQPIATAACLEPFHKSAVSHIRNLLYDKPVWESGELVNSIVALAAGLTSIGVEVTIVTSNYDTYIEQGFETYWDRMKTGLSPHFEAKKFPFDDQRKSIPKLFVTYLGSDEVRVRGPKDSVSQAKLIYVHGSIDDNGKVHGQLALSESDYHRAHNKVVQFLQDLFFAKNLLILGASLTDPPLLEALYKSQYNDQVEECCNIDSIPSSTLSADTDGQINYRYALVPAVSTGFSSLGQSQFPTVIQCLKQRLERYSTTLLVPDFHSQITQFVREVLICAKMGERFSDYQNIDNPPRERYGERLIAWWDSWHTGSIAIDPEGISRQLTECIQNLRSNWANRISENYKLELWVRFDPRNNRQLALWASSSGVLTDRSCMKKEELDLGTKNVAVRGFIEGKPIWLAKADLSDETLPPHKKLWIEMLDGRWSRYLVVPIQLNEPSQHYEGNPQITVGVISFASFSSGTENIDKTNIPINSAAHMLPIIDSMRNLGRSLLNTGYVE